MSGTMKSDKAATGLAGEYYVLAQLAHRGLVGAMTLSHTKAVDILVTNQRLNTLYRVEVKTTGRSPYREHLFGNKPFFMWPMSVKHETIRDRRLFYCFVALQALKERPRFFIVPSETVATYVRDQHVLWLKSRRGQVRDTPLRKFRVPVDDPEGYEDRWDHFDH